MALAPDDPRHGTHNGYNNWRCRCDECRAAHAASHREWHQRRRGLPPGDPRHGTTIGYYGHSCRCDKCREAAAERRRLWKKNAREKAS